jgi:organic radical activating enzyme
MYCKHCYRDAGVKAEEELSTEEGLTLIDQIAGAGFKIMIFSGGEPLMREDIFDLVRHARKKGLRPVFGTSKTNWGGFGSASSGAEIRAKRGSSGRFAMSVSKSILGKSSESSAGTGLENRLY